MTLEVFPGANSKRTSPRINFSGLECSETREAARIWCCTFIVCSSSFALVLFCFPGLLVLLRQTSDLILLPWPSCSSLTLFCFHSLLGFLWSYSASIAFLFSSGLILLPFSFCSASLVLSVSPLHIPLPSFSTFGLFVLLPWHIVLPGSLAHLLIVPCYSCVSYHFIGSMDLSVFAQKRVIWRMYML